MIYEIIVRLFGTDILWSIGFISCTLGYNDNTLTVSAAMRQPVTQQIQQLVKNGLKFRVEQNLIVIINDQNSYTRSIQKSFVWNNGWFVNGALVDDKELQKEMGATSYSFSHFTFSENDVVLVFLESTILPDEEFTVSTGFKTQVLWNFYSPKVKCQFIYKNGAFVKQ